MKDRCGRDALVVCPCCHSFACVKCAQLPVCITCGERLDVNPDRFDEWLDIHLRDQEAARSLEDKVV